VDGAARRIDVQAGYRVLVLGATGNAGRMAIQVAKRFGASQVIAAGRDPIRLAAPADLGADLTCTFDELDQAADVDIVLAYVWSAPAARATVDMLAARTDRGAALTWIEIGSSAGRVPPRRQRPVSPAGGAPAVCGMASSQVVEVLRS
jgi:NADPH:quinone reductase-like Zn-dependent oxidoreductase